MYVYMLVSIRICVYTYIYAYTYICMFVCVQMHILMYMHTCINVCSTFVRFFATSRGTCFSFLFLLHSNLYQWLLWLCHKQLSVDSEIKIRIRIGPPPVPLLENLIAAIAIVVTIVLLCFEQRAESYC